MPLTHPLLPEFRRWLIREWGNLDPFTESLYGLAVPSPVLALEADRLLGGMAFTRHPRAPLSGFPLWINVLLVAPRYRQRGLGRRLVLAAEPLARASGESRLLVNTDIPRFYEKLGWHLEEDQAGNAVLSKALHQ